MVESPPCFFHQTTKLFLFRAKLSTNVLAKEWPVVQPLLRFKKTPRQRGNERSEKKNNECKHSSYTNSTHSFPDYPQRIQEIFQVASLQFQKVSNQQCFKTLTFQSKKPDSSIHRKTYRFCAVASLPSNPCQVHMQAETASIFILQLLLYDAFASELWSALRSAMAKKHDQ